ncbi:uncharacterized protein G2W53_017425 [Senna tora]|uniref:Uncharacterized protein n=1 Tax=Senna tora TaxID=362788 RepID=A0A834TT22_9FABA|nr:uncharacterized protein G2W53_017425 [Senna tora]
MCTTVYFTEKPNGKDDLGKQGFRGSGCVMSSVVVAVFLEPILKIDREEMGLGLDNLLKMKVDLVEVGDIMVDSLGYFEKTHQYHRTRWNLYVFLIGVPFLEFFAHTFPPLLVLCSAIDDVVIVVMVWERPWWAPLIFP